MTAAQRMSILIKAKDTTDVNYLIHADMDVTQLDEIPDDLQLSMSFIDREHFAVANKVKFRSYCTTLL